MYNLLFFLLKETKIWVYSFKFVSEHLFTTMSFVEAFNSVGMKTCRKINSYINKTEKNNKSSCFRDTFTFSHGDDFNEDGDIKTTEKGSNHYLVQEWSAASLHTISPILLLRDDINIYIPTFKIEKYGIL